MNEPKYVSPTSVSQAVEALRQANGDGLVVAGGIVVGSLINQRLAAPNVLVDITRIDSMQHITRTPNDITIGALVSHTQIMRSADVRAVAPLLSEIAVEISCPRLRNRGTLGGSLCTIGGQGDPATGLIALGAQLRIIGPDGTRHAALENFYTDAFAVDLQPEEIVESVIVPTMPAEACFGFYKLAPRGAMDFTQITAAVTFTLESGAPTNIRIGMNGLANTPNRPRATEKLIGGSKLDSIDWSAVAETLNGEISPQSDLVYSEGFKRHLALVTLRRAIERAAARNSGTGAHHWCRLSISR